MSLGFSAKPIENHTLMFQSILAALIIFLVAPFVLPAQSAAGGTPSVEESYATQIQQSLFLLQGGKYDEALKALDQADALFPNRPVSLNTRGAILLRQKDFVKAGEYFNKASEADPKDFAPRFNLGELEFVRKEYMAARNLFSALLVLMEKEDHPLRPLNNDQVLTRELLKFKIFLSYLMENNAKEVEARLDRKLYDPSYPTFALVQAGKCLHKNDKDGAAFWLQSAGRIHPQQVLALYLDSFIEMGWITPAQPMP
jgi:tetratricopeptide (TPR) repeat protein